MGGANSWLWPDPQRVRRARERRARELRRQGLTYAEIGARIGLTRSGVAYLLGRVGAAGRVGVQVLCQGCGAEVARGRPGFRRQEVLCPGCLGPRGATFGQRLRACRLAAGLSQGELARQSGIARTAVQNYEQGRGSPRPGSLAGLVRVLGPGLVIDPPAQGARRR